MPRRSVLRLCAVTLSVGLLGCSDLTRVTNPSLTSPGQLDNGLGGIARRAGALSLFGAYFSTQVEYAGLISDEMTDARGATAYADRRLITANAPANGAGYPWQGLSEARLQSLRAIQTIETYHSAAKDRVGELFALIGFVETMFAENLCSGVPLADVINGTPTLGPTLTRNQLLARALIDFDSATANAFDTLSATDTSILSLANVGRARALVDSGDFSKAMSAAAAVSSNFAYQTQYSVAGGQQNQVAADFLANNISVSDREGENGLDFASAADPRVLVDTFSSFGILGNLVGHHFLPYYTQLQPPVDLASGLEARLIQAEAALHAGDLPTWSNALNSLRQTYADTALSNHPLPSDSTTQANVATQVDIMFRERAFWLYATGHRHGDLRRLMRQYGRIQSQVFPVGAYAGAPSAQYGTDITFVPFGENNNPNYHGCFDRLP
jgi:hypothetical protein